AVRRTHLGARSRNGGRSITRHPPARRRRPQHDSGDTRNEICPGSLGSHHLHAQRTHRRRRPSRSVVRPARIRTAAPISASRLLIQPGCIQPLKGNNVITTFLQKAVLGAGLALVALSATADTLKIGTEGGYPPWSMV